MSDNHHRLAVIAALLAFCVVVLGAYVRLSDAGLGCPDWPGCYGKLWVEDDVAAHSAAREAYPERPLESAKAWKEMVHRYAAGTLGLLVLALAVQAFRRRAIPGQPVALPFVLLGLVIFQALLGMWTVTLKLLPPVVMGHLLGGMTLLAGLVWLALATRAPSLSERVAMTHGVRGWALAALVALAVQIALGGWTSSNYAALACHDFPTCQDVWWPPMDFAEGFTPWRGIGPDYEGGVLGIEARTAIQVTHRLGALVVFVLVLLAGHAALRVRSFAVRHLGAVALLLVTVQFALGIANVLMGLPVVVAAAHNGVAALLLVTLLALNRRVRETQ